MNTCARPICPTLLALVLFATGSCATPSPAQKKNDKQLRSSVASFHRYLRWQKYDKALNYIDESEKESFRGRYREYEEGFNIVNLRLVSVDRTGKKAIVEVRQEYYRDDSMVLQKEQMIEIWEPTGERWRLVKRVKKDIWDDSQSSDKRSVDKPDDV